MARSYHHPEPVPRDITSISAHAFTSKKDGTLYAVVELGNGGSLWLSGPDLARQLIAAAGKALAILLPEPPPSVADHAFVRPGQVSADRPPRDRCVVCGEPEAAHDGPFDVAAGADPLAIPANRIGDPAQAMCGSCGKNPVRDRTSPSLDGQFCGPCLDRCADSELADHVCAVDRWAEAQGQIVAEVAHQAREAAKAGARS